MSFSAQEEELAPQPAPLAAQGHCGGAFDVVVLVLLRACAVGVPRLHVPEQGPGRHLRDVRQEQVIIFILWILSHKGPCTNDVSTQGGGGVSPISDDRRGRLRDIYTINSDRGRGGQKSRKLG